MVGKTIRNLFILFLAIMIVGVTISNGYTHGNILHTYYLEGSVNTGGIFVEADGGLVNPVIGQTPGEAVLLNKDGVPLRNVPTLAFISDESQEKAKMDVGQPISGDLEPRATTRGLALPAQPNPITFGDWTKASVYGVVKVMDDDTAVVCLTFKNLIPNSYYTIWQFNEDMYSAVPNKNDGPFGGIPNGVLTDFNGKGHLVRKLPFNPIGFIKRLVVMYHSDNSVYGGAPFHESGGIIHHGQLQIDFP